MAGVKKRKKEHSDFLYCSLSGCPRAKKGGIKITPTKDDKEDSELQKYVFTKQFQLLLYENSGFIEHSLYL